MFVRMQVSIPGIYVGFNPGSPYHVSFINICLAEREPTFKTFSIATLCSHKRENLNTDLFYIHIPLGITCIKSGTLGSKKPIVLYRGYPSCGGTEVERMILYSL